MSTLRQRIEARLREVAGCVVDGKYTRHHKTDLSDVYLCAELSDMADAAAGHIDRLASAIILDERTRRTVLANSALLERWPWVTGITSDFTAGNALFDLHMLIASEGISSWPIEVSPLDVAKALERVGDPEAKRVASMLRKGRVPTSELDNPGAPFDGKIVIDVTSPTWKKGQTAWLRWYPPAVAQLVYFEREDESSALYGARIAWNHLTSLPKNREKLSEIARQALSEADEPATDVEAIESLVPALQNALRRLCDTVGINDQSPRTESDALAELDGILRPDEMFARFLESKPFGQRGQEFANAVRKRSASRILKYKEQVSDSDGMSEPPSASSLWYPWLEPERFAVTLGIALWKDDIAERLREKRRKPPSLVRTVYTDTLDFHSRASAFNPTNKTLTFQGRDIAKIIDASFDLSIIEKGLSILGSVAAHRLFRWEVITGHNQDLAGVNPANILEVHGGWSGLAQVLGLNPDKHIPDLKAIVYAQGHFRFTFPDGSQGNMLAYQEKDAKGRTGKARLTITLGPPLMPHYYRRLPKGLERKLVPLLRELPPLHGRPNEHGQQLTMSLAIMAVMRDRATEMLQRGGVLLDDDNFVRLADRSGLPRKLIHPVRELWTQGDDKNNAPPFLKLIEPQRYTLSDVHKAEREFIEEGGRMELGGKAGGQKRIAKKHANLKRLCLKRSK